MIEALPGKVLVHNMERGEQVTASGIILTNDEGTSTGIRNRWAQVYSVGKGVNAIEAGEWVLIEHGRWSRGIEVNDTEMYLVDYPAGVMAASLDKPEAHSEGIYETLALPY